MEINLELDPDRLVVSGDVILDVEASSDERGFVKKSGYRVLKFSVQALIYRNWVDVTNCLPKDQIQDLKHRLLIHAETKHYDDIEEEFNNPFGDKELDCE